MHGLDTKSSENHDSLGITNTVSVISLLRGRTSVTDIVQKPVKDIVMALHERVGFGKHVLE